MVFTTIYDKQEENQVHKKCVPPLQLEAALANSMLDHLSALNTRSKSPLLRLSGIICTIGIASREPHVIEQLIENGMNIACLDLTHGYHSHHAEVLQNIRSVSKNYNKKIGAILPLAVAILMKGPVILTNFPIGGSSIEMTLTEGQTIKVTGREEYIMEENKSNYIHFTYEHLHTTVRVGSEIIINDRRIILVVTEIDGVVVTCEVIKGGDIRNRQRVYLPGLPVDFPALFEKDKGDIQFAIEHDVDIIFAPYIRSAECVKEIRDCLPEASDLVVISQIENRQGVLNIDEIIKASDGIIISRGNLGNDIEDKELFLAQKSIISKCNTVGKPVIVTTHMLESMISCIIPSRAERCDVANAILDGVDCIMLCHETAFGNYPVEALRVAAGICKQAEAAVWQKQLVIDLSDTIIPPIITIHALAAAAVQISLQILASAIIVISSSLKSAHLLTQYRPKCPVVAVTRNLKKARQAHLFRAIVPLLYKEHKHQDWNKDVNMRVYYGINFGRKKGFIRPGDPVVIMTGSKQGSGFTDRMKIEYVPTHIYPGVSCIC